VSGLAALWFAFVLFVELAA
jgi:hypothetical protein